jgi:hypothetical protein
MRQSIQAGNVGCFEATDGMFQEERHALALIEERGTLARDGAVVDEHLLAAFSVDGSVALGSVKPADNARSVLGHAGLLRTEKGREDDGAF